MYNMYNHSKSFGGVAAKKKIKSLVSSENALSVPSPTSCQSHDEGPVVNSVSKSKKEINNFFSDPDLAYSTRWFPVRKEWRRDEIKRHPNV